MFLKQFAEFNSICIQCHDSPDADAMGAAFGLYAYFMNLGKKVNLIYAGEHQITKPSLKLIIRQTDRCVILCRLTESVSMK